MRLGPAGKYTLHAERGAIKLPYLPCRRCLRNMKASHCRCFPTHIVFTQFAQASSFKMKASKKIEVAANGWQGASG